MQPQKRVSSHETSNKLDTESIQTPKEMPTSDVATNRDKAVLLVENNQTFPDKTPNKENQNVDGDGAAADALLSETISNNELNVSINSMEAEAPGSDTNSVPLKSNDKHTSENISEVYEGPPPQRAASIDDNTSHNDGPVESSQAIVHDDAGSPENNEHEGLQSASGDDPGKVDQPVEDTNAKAEKVSDLNKLPEHKTTTTSMKVQEQLDEVKDLIILVMQCFWFLSCRRLFKFLLFVQAQGLLKSTSSTGQSKEARLARVFHSAILYNHLS